MTWLRDTSTWLALSPLALLGISILSQKFGAPIPVLPMLIYVGAQAAGSISTLLSAWLIATVAALPGDAMWFELGRRFGRRVLGWLCTLSVTPDSCVRSSELNFQRNRVMAVIASKFVPGLSTIAPPTAGALGMALGPFIWASLVGSALWAGAGLLLGALLHQQLDAVQQSMARLAWPAIYALFVPMLGYVIWRAAQRFHGRQRLAHLPRVTPHGFNDLLRKSRPHLLLDLRVGATSLPRPPGVNSIPMDLRTLQTGKLPAWSEEVQLITACDCPGDVSAAQAAWLLRKRGRSALVLSGGLESWLQALAAIQQPAQ